MWICLLKFLCLRGRVPGKRVISMGSDCSSRVLVCCVHILYSCIGDYRKKSCQKIKHGLKIVYALLLIEILGSKQEKLAKDKKEKRQTVHFVWFILDSEQRKK